MDPVAQLTHQTERHFRDRVAAGDETALAEVYDRYASLVYGLALRVMRDAKAAEDVTQDVFVYLWEQPLAFDPARGSLRSFLGVLTHRRAVDWVRRETATRRREERDAEREARTQLDIAETATSSVMATRVRAVVASLPGDQRSAVELAYFDALTYRQVAEKLQVPEGTAKSRLRLGLRKLAEALRAEGFEEWT